MILQEVFKPEYIKVDMEAEDKEEAFEELVDFFCQNDKSIDRDDILLAIKEREAKMSTGIHKGIAIPHGRTGAVSTIKGVLGISSKGIVYDSLDGEPVTLLFLLITPLEDSEKYLRVLKNIADLIENPQFQLELQAQKDPKNVHKVLCKYDEFLSAVLG